METLSTERRAVVVTGGGQAGLAVGYYLARQGRDFTILEAASGPAASWTARWDSLRLFTPARYSGLPGRPFPGDPNAYPSRDDVVAYLTDYARDFDLPVEYGSRCAGLRRRRPPRTRTRRHRVTRALLPRAHVAAHAGLRPARLGQGRRRLHRRADRCLNLDTR